MTNYQNIKVDNERFSFIAESLLSGKIKTKDMISCLHGLLVDDSEARDRITNTLLGIPVDYSEGIKEGHTILVPKGEYYLSDYDIDTCINNGYIVDLVDKSAYRSHGVVASVLKVRPYSSTITFDVVFTLIKKSNDELVKIHHTLGSDEVTPFEDGKS